MKLTNFINFFRFNGAKFVKVTNQTIFKNGDILRKESLYYIIKGNNLKKINKEKAYKLIKRNNHKKNLKILGKSRKSKKKSRNQASDYQKDEKPLINNKANGLLESLIRKDSNLRKISNKLWVSSINGRKYGIDLSTGDVYYKNKKLFEIHSVACFQIPLAYQIIAKSLTIAYKPYQIWPTIDNLSQEERENYKTVKLIAKELLDSIIEADPHLKQVNREIKINSINGKIYYLNLENGKVNRADGKFCCIGGLGLKNLPLEDIILAKTLTIVYSPSQINTL
ncbi:MAG: hypothetical protein HWN67_02360 [Candidatus Helarchaeota archaeon]|nr:hypothetical protein [Candidatus Helarchaeota archaeon]